LFKVIAMTEGLGAQLDPDFKVLEFATPYLRRMWLRSRSLDRVARQLAAGLLDLADMGLELPQRLRRLLSQVERGELGVRIQHEGLDEAVERLNQIMNRWR
jgi:ubiquinone biosynthesis protein